MAKRGSSREKPSAKLSDDEKRAAIERLRARINDLNELDLQKIVNDTSEVIQPINARIRATLASIYGEDTTDFARLESACYIDDTP
jgi:hypothetical protein